MLWSEHLDFYPPPEIEVLHYPDNAQSTTRLVRLSHVSHGVTAESHSTWKRRSSTNPPPVSSPFLSLNLQKRNPESAIICLSGTALKGAEGSRAEQLGQGSYSDFDIAMAINISSSVSSSAASSTNFCS